MTSRSTLVQWRLAQIWTRHLSCLGQNVPRSGCSPTGDTPSSYSTLLRVTLHSTPFFNTDPIPLFLGRNTGFNSRNLVPSLITLSMFLAQVATFWASPQPSPSKTSGVQLHRSLRHPGSTWHYFSVDPCGTTLTTLMTDGTILRSRYHTTLCVCAMRCVIWRALGITYWCVHPLVCTLSSDFISAATLEDEPSVCPSRPSRRVSSKQRLPLVTPTWAVS
jgi:hypothetical protein